VANRPPQPSAVSFQPARAAQRRSSKPTAGSSWLPTADLLLTTPATDTAVVDGHFRIVLQFERMSQTITVRLTAELAEWLQEKVRQTGLPAGRIIREQLERAKSEGGNQLFLRHAGKIGGGPRDLSSRKGFSRS